MTCINSVILGYSFSEVKILYKQAEFFKEKSCVFDLCTFFDYKITPRINDGRLRRSAGGGIRSPDKLAT